MLNNEEVNNVSKDKEDLESLTRKELVDIAKKLKIKNYSRMSKTDLIKNISTNENFESIEDISQSEDKNKSEVSNEKVTEIKDKEDLESLTRKELVDIAKNLKIKNYSRMSKSELIKNVSKENLTISEDKTGTIEKEKSEILQTEKVEEEKTAEIDSTKKEEEIVSKTNSEETKLQTDSDKENNLEQLELLKTFENDNALEELPRKDLVEVAKNLKIKNYSRMSKSELITEISNEKTLEEELKANKKNQSSELKEEFQNLEELSRQELVEIAKDLKIKNYSRLSKTRLIKLISEEKQTTSQKNDIQEIGENKKLPYTDKRSEKVIEDEIKYKILLQPSKFTFGNINKEYLFEDEENLVLPDLYDEDNITLLPIDPYRLFTYWDLSKETIDLIKKFEVKELLIKINDVTGIIYNGTNALDFWFEKCLPLSRNWYINLDEERRNVCVELGYTLNNKFFIIAKSNTINVPPRTTSSIVKDKFAIVNYLIEESKTEKEEEKVIQESEKTEDTQIHSIPLEIPSINTDVPKHFVKEYDITGPIPKPFKKEESKFSPPPKLVNKTDFAPYPLSLFTQVDKEIHESIDYSFFEEEQQIQEDFSIQNQESNVFENHENFISNVQNQPIIYKKNTHYKLPENISSPIKVYYEWVGDEGKNQNEIVWTSDYFELPETLQGPIKIFYEWKEGDTPYRKEFYWISDEFPVIHEKVYKISWGPTWVKEFIGGSEIIRYLGASERFIGSSDRFLGGSEYMLGGSERFIGASEEVYNYPGASDIVYQGASENMLSGVGITNRVNRENYKGSSSTINTLLSYSKPFLGSKGLYFSRV